MSEDDESRRVPFSIDVYIGFATPVPFAPEAAPLVDPHYGADYHNRRAALADELVAYNVRFGSLRRIDGDWPRYAAQIERVHASAVSFADACRAMYDRVSADRESTPAVEFAWSFVEPVLLFDDHYEPTSDDDTDTATSARSGAPPPADEQAVYNPPALPTFRSPSAVFELCGALTLLVAIQLRLLACERYRNEPRRVEPLAAVLRELARVARTYVVVPACESHGYTHPPLCSVHFVERVLAPLAYAQALALCTDIYLASRAARASCIKAAVFNMSAELLLDDVCTNAPPLFCSSTQRRMLRTLAEDRQAAAYVNLGGAGLANAASMTADAAVDADVDARRREWLHVARVMLETACALSDEPTLKAHAEALYTRVRAALPDTPAALTPHDDHWPIVAYAEADEARPLDARALIALVPATVQCRVAVLEQPEQVAIVLVECRALRFAE